MEFRVRNRWKCYRRLTVNRLYQKHVHLSGTVRSKAVEIWWKICLVLVGHQRLQLKLASLKWNDCLGMTRLAARLVPKYLTHHLTRVSLWTNFWPETQRISSNNHRIHLIWLRQTFFSFQNSNYYFEAPFSFGRRHKKEFAAGTEANVLMVELFVGISVLYFGRGLLWRW